MAGVAQSVERQIVALEVASSKLVARPTNLFNALEANLIYWGVAKR